MPIRPSQGKIRKEETEAKALLGMEVRCTRAERALGLESEDLVSNSDWSAWDLI